MVCLACLMEYCAFIPKVVFVFVFNDVCMIGFPIEYYAFLPKVFKSALSLHLLNFTSSTPQAVLAAVIMTAVIFSVEHHVIHPIWNSKRKTPWC